MNKNSTRYYSSQQEKQIAKTVKGNRQSNSGAGVFAKGDIKTDDWLFEAKTCMTEKQSFSIRKEWIDKLKQESLSMNKEYYSLVFNFGSDKDNYYILDERIFKKILNLLQQFE